LTDGLEKLLNPFCRFGLPAHELAMMMTIALRFIPTLLQETQRIMMAQSARGADFKTGPLSKKARNILALIVPLFLSAFRRADELATAMESRCYRGGEGRTRMKELSLGGRDLAAALLVAGLSLALALLGRYAP
jgi:energy-coupling factor transport system permease protein